MITKVSGVDRQRRGRAGIFMGRTITSRSIIEGIKFPRRIWGARSFRERKLAYRVAVRWVCSSQSGSVTLDLFLDI